MSARDTKMLNQRLAECKILVSAAMHHCKESGEQWRNNRDRDSYDYDTHIVIVSREKVFQFL